MHVINHDGSTNVCACVSCEQGTLTIDEKITGILGIQLCTHLAGFQIVSTVNKFGLFAPTWEYGRGWWGGGGVDISKMSMKLHCCNGAKRATESRWQLPKFPRQNRKERAPTF